MTPSEKKSPKSEWGDASRLALLRKWRPQGLAAGRPYTEALLATADLRPGIDVLDVACGAGEPALELARRVGPTGSVLGIDPSELLVGLAREYAQEEGLSQVVFKVGTAEALPLPDRSVDRVTSRFGPMYFPDLPRALSETRRVLRPGGRLAWLVWGSLARPFWEATILVVARYAGLSELPPEAAQPFRFAPGGILANLFKQAGFEAVTETRLEIPWSWKGTPSEVCEWSLSGSPPFRAIIESLSGPAREQMVEEVTRKLTGFYAEGRVTLPSQVITATGT
ncbi:MAG TPA: methyltransferase domain-containing protein, partial [Thermoplasmata archaeon]|nr:methyltransferase domain-containing protein [Thermoplasmata archaeon]